MMTGNEITMLVALANKLTTYDRLSLIAIADTWAKREEGEKKKKKSDQIAFLSSSSNCEIACAASKILRFPGSSARRK